MSLWIENASTLETVKIPDSVINPIVANVLFGAARESGLSQTKLAKAADMSLVTVQKLLSGKQGIKVAQFIALANATNLTPTDLMHRISAAINKQLSEAADNVTVEDNVFYMGRVVPPARAAADKSERVQPKD